MKRIDTKLHVRSCAQAVAKFRSDQGLVGSFPDCTAARVSDLFQTPDENKKSTQIQTHHPCWRGARNRKPLTRCDCRFDYGVRDSGIRIDDMEESG